MKSKIYIIVKHSCIHVGNLSLIKNTKFNNVYNEKMLLIIIVNVIGTLGNLWNTI